MNNLYPAVQAYIEQLDTENISSDRKDILDEIIGSLQSLLNKDKGLNLTFVCTHNSRRSHLSQVWAQTMAHYFETERVYCYSAGTESTALFPVVAETLKKQGLTIVKLSEGKNPVYSIKSGPGIKPVIGFSKTLDHPYNPEKGFAAIMTCSSANESCPFVPGASARLALEYEDPKAFDGTPQQLEKYEERSKQIATELKYIFSKLTVS
ncbi:protein-tyrosine-phosphatase [Robertkochia aurantiaca]|uniref:protein-tyrosine-phosphatase n=1 Tax=Robertkochia aurantiaca TaxID=2873700 RepID=UPI001CCEA5B7|nr:protein-tyrosine-phosphatase [Robertkochia sp. 3YJGBD-33]